jgi:hypothetical protein
MVETAAVTQLAHTIQLSVAPVFLLAGISGFLNVVAGRLARVVDRARVLEREFTPQDHADHARQVWELRVLDRRIKYANRAIALCAASGVMICLVVAGLFTSALAGLGFGRTMAVMFVLAMALLIAGLACFLVEVRVAAETLRVRDELLEREARR